MHGFVEAGGLIHAIPAPAGAAFISFGGILFPAREPVTADERHAVHVAERGARREALRPRIAKLTDADAVALMATKIAQRAAACGAVMRDDFRQAGVPDAMIDANLDAAFARARRMDGRIDAMAATP